MESLSLSVVVPVHYLDRNYPRCLKSLSETNPSPEEIIIVVDGDTEGAWRSEEPLEASVLRTPSIRGPAVARNLGARKAGGDILLFVDADVTVSRDIVKRVLDLFEHDTALAAVIGSYDDSPGAPNFLSQYKNLFHHYTHQHSREDASTFWGACGARISVRHSPCSSSWSGRSPRPSAV